MVEVSDFSVTSWKSLTSTWKSEVICQYKLDVLGQRMDKISRFSFEIDSTTKCDLFACVLFFKQKHTMQAFKEGELDCARKISIFLSMHTQKWCVARETSPCS